MFDLGNMKRNLERIPDRVEEALYGYGETAAALLQGEAQRNRPWIDRTGHARQRIKGYCVRTENGVRIYLAHGVDYGVYLEFAHEKKYAIIYPTLRRKGPEIIAGAMKVVRK